MRKELVEKHAFYTRSVQQLLGREVSISRIRHHRRATHSELLHRNHVIHELIDGDLGALLKA
jgi:hypothetical protein